jgi:hypothetical protein
LLASGYASIVSRIKRKESLINSQEKDMQSVTAKDRTPIASSKTTTKLTRALLTCGVIAGPLYIVLGVIQMLIRPGFDIRRHALSLLSNG